MDVWLLVYLCKTSDVPCRVKIHGVHVGHLVGSIYSWLDIGFVILVYSWSSLSDIGYFWQSVITGTKHRPQICLFRHLINKAFVSSMAIDVALC